MTVIGTLSTFPTGRREVMDQEEPMGVMRMTRQEMEVISAELRIKASLRAKPPLPEFLMKVP